MTYTLEFKLKGLPKMPNELLRGHWRKKHGHALKWKAAVESETRRFVKPPQPLTSAALTLTRHSSHEPDYDGLVGSFKHVIDGLVECGILAGDKRANIGQPNYAWAKASPGKGFVSVRVEALEMSRNENSNEIVTTKGME